MALSLAAIAPGLAVLAYTQHEIDRSRHEEVQDLAVRSARQAAFELDRIVAGVRILLIAVSQVPDVRDGNEAGCNSYLADLEPRLPYLAGLAVLDSGGRFRCGFKWPSSAADSFAAESYLRDALRTRDAVIGEYTVAPFSGGPVLPVAIAMRDGEGRPRGVLVAALDLAWLGQTLKARGLPPGGSLTIADRDGVIIARQPLSELFVGTRIPDPYMRLLTAPGPGWEEVTSQDGTRRVLGYVPLSEPPVGLYISAGLSASSSYGTVNRAARFGALLAITGALSTLLATWTMGDGIFVRPLREITGVLRSWRAGERAARTRYVAGGGELAELGAELDRLMDEIGRGEEQRRLLADELEHRVKNTLATVQALASMTMNRTAPGKDLLPDFLARVNALASTHEVLTRERWDSADLRELVAGVLRPLIGDIEPRVRLRGPEIQLSPGEALGVTMVVHELCTNALKYGSLGSADGHVDLTWLVRDREGGRLLAMTWRELDGPPVSRPEGKTGFGTRMIGRALGGFGRAEVEYDPAGVICRIEIDMAESAERLSSAPRRI
jgi:two-component sensor histidine kinase